MIGSVQLLQSVDASSRAQAFVFRLWVPCDWAVTYEEFHLRDLFVYLLHELDDEVDQLVLQHLFCMEVGDEE